MYHPLCSFLHSPVTSSLRPKYCPQHLTLSKPGSSVGIATDYGLEGPGIEYLWKARFSAPVQTGPGSHPASCRMDTGSFTGGKERPGHDADRSPLLVPWSRKSRAIPLLPLWAVRHVYSLSACTRVHFILLYFTLFSNTTTIISFIKYLLH